MTPLLGYASSEIILSFWSEWAASTLFTRSLGESEEQERDGFMTVDQEWKWYQVCGFPACSATSVSSKRNSWKHSIHSRFITSHIESFEPILLCISSHLSPSYVQLPCQLPHYYPMECLTSWLLSNGVLNFLIRFHSIMPKDVADMGLNTIKTFKFPLQEDCGVFHDPRSYRT